jgi:SsrA-binding protein
MSTLATNKRARFNYEIIDTYEAGIALLGHEVKSIRLGNVNLNNSYCTFKDHELYLTNAHISPYKFAGHLKDYDPIRPRKLLLTKKELKKLIGKTQQKGLTIVPIKMYTKGKHIKVEIAVAKGKRKTHKKELLKKRDIQRDIQRTLKNL